MPVLTPLTGLRSTARRVAAVAAASGTGTGCPRAAGYYVVTLLGIKTPADFTETIKEAFKQAMGRLAPGAPVEAPAACLVLHMRCLRLQPRRAASQGGAAVLLLLSQRRDNCHPC